MTEEKLKTIAGATLGTDINCVNERNVSRPELLGLRFFEEPIFAFAAADDPLFAELRKNGALNPGVMLPTDFLPSARTVISWFLPFTEAVRAANRRDMSRTADEWRYARVEGQEANFAVGESFCRAIEQEGFAALQPSRDSRFRMLSDFEAVWSERHAAYVAGLGTFGLSKGLITKKGIAGRFGSIVTDVEIAPTKREYSSPFEYCIMCGACARNCPGAAIDPALGVKDGKSHPKCHAFVTKMTEIQKCGDGERKRFGCGKCQIKVPCETSIPNRKK